MDILEEKEAFLNVFVNYKGDSRKIQFNEETKQFMWRKNNVSDTEVEYVHLMNQRWYAWLACAKSKAQAVPEGFALVKKVHPDAIVHNQGLGLFKECQIIYGWDGKSKDFKDALNKGFYHGVKLGAKAVLETAMIEAQEPAND